MNASNFEADMAPGTSRTVQPQAARPRTILVVDDDRDAADTIAVLLEASGMSVLAAYSAREGLDRLDEHPDIGLVVSDIRMPGVDGFDFLRVVKHRFPKLPTVLTTGLPVTDDDIVPHGALILQKPFAVEDLKRAIAEQLQIDLDARLGPR
ncbi:MAG TPA: response regulator [Casimicrobiaceae bacterium]|nr:response regulator [Casimicrobiaceae bacterium]